MTPSSVRHVRFGGSRIRVESQGPGTAALIEFLYRNIPDDPGIPAHISFRLHRDREVFRLQCGDALRYEGTSSGRAAEALLRETTYHLADKNRDGVLLHAAAVARHGQCLLLPGKTGAGKTTLVAWLVTKGYAYLTDELVYIARESQRVTALRRPLNVKTGALAVLRALGVHIEASETVSSLTATLVPHVVLGDRSPWSTPPLAGLMFPHYQPGHPFRVEPLSRGQAALALIECLINARNLPTLGVSEVARLTTGVWAYRMHYAHCAQVEEWMTEHLDSQLQYL